MAKILYLIQKKIDKLDREKNHFDYFERDHKIEFLNLSDFFKDFFDLSFLTLLKNWKQILKIIKRINLYRPNYIFVHVATTNLTAEIIKWLVLTFTKKSKIIISENSLPDLNLSKKNIFKEFNPRITNLLGKFFLLVNGNKIIFLKRKKREGEKNILLCQKKASNLPQNNSLPTNLPLPVFDALARNSRMAALASSG